MLARSLADRDAREPLVVENAVSASHASAYMLNGVGDATLTNGNKESDTVLVLEIIFDAGGDGILDELGNVMRGSGGIEIARNLQNSIDNAERHGGAIDVDGDQIGRGYVVAK